MGISYDSGPMIPYPDLKCICTHKKLQHAQLGTENCDNCDCYKFRKRLSASAVIDLEPKMPEAPDPGHDMCVVPDSVAANRGATETKGSVIVGIESHTFHGNGTHCEGILGYGPTSPRYREVCNLPRAANVHQVTGNWATGSNEDSTSSRRRMPEIRESGLKDSGQRLQFASGMVRDIDDTKPAFDLVIPEGIPYNELMLTRWAELLRKGAIKYERRNWEKADSDKELERAKASAFRHFMQWFTGENDEDHAAAVFFNINEVETIRYKQRVKESG